MAAGDADPPVTHQPESSSPYAVDGPFAELRHAVSTVQPDSARYPDDPYVLATLHEALSAAEEDNFGVGAALVDERGHIIARGHNRVFTPRFRSDLHAEMDVLNQFEEEVVGHADVRGLSLYTSYEPCPMCTGRLITAGIPRIYFAAPDPSGGMVQRLRDLPAVWVDLARTQEFVPARCDPRLAELAARAMATTFEKCQQRLLARRGR